LLDRKYGIVRWGGNISKMDRQNFINTEEVYFKEGRSVNLKKLGGYYFKIGRADLYKN
jgi:hypothetical protein